MATYIYNPGGVVSTNDDTSGDDQWNINGVLGNEVTGRVLDTTGGNDTLTANYFTYGSMDFGAGNDIVIMNNSSGSNSNIDLGVGNDILTMDSSTTRYITADTGDDTITLTNTAVTVDISLGTGSNTLFMEDSSARYILGGNDDDDVEIKNSAITYDIRGRSGTNDITVDGSTARDVNGGNDIDNIVVTNGSVISAIDAGNGTNSIEVSVGSTTANITGGSGDDTVTITDSTTDNISTENGNDTIIITNSNTGYVRDIGTGDSEITITDSTVNGYVYTWTGNDSITITNTTVDSYIRTYSGDDVVSLTNTTVTNRNGVRLDGGDDTITLHDVVLSAAGADIQGDAGDDTFIVTSFSAADIKIDGGTNSGVGDTLDLSGMTTPYTITYTSADQEDGYVTYVTNGVTHTLTFVEIENIIAPPIPCFTAGTYIETEHGKVLIETLKIGDMIRTADHGLQPIRWIGSSRVIATGEDAPVMIKKGALGNSRDLLVSPSHRMLINDWRAMLMFDKDEVLVAAKDLVNNDTIYVQLDNEVTYYHVMFDRHQIIFAEDTPSESFYAGAYILNGLEQETVDEIFHLFPELKETGNDYGPTARTSLTAYEAKIYASLM